MRKVFILVLVMIAFTSQAWAFGGRGIDSPLGQLNYTPAQINATLGLSKVITCTGTASTDKAAIDAALTALSTAGGGTMVIVGICRYDDQLVMPHDSSTIWGQAPIRITGIGGGSSDGVWYPTTATPPSALDLRYSTASGPKIATYGRGYLEIDHLTLMDGGAANNSPFIYTTNTTLNIHDNTFRGTQSNADCVGASDPRACCSGSNAGTCPDASNDGIVLGGTGDIGNDTTAAFQGYGTRIKNNFFDRIRVAVNLQKYANSNIISENTISPTCGYSTGAAFILKGTTDSIYGNVFAHNLIELTNYKYAFDLQERVMQNSFLSNGIWDAGVNTTAVFNLGATIVRYNLMQITIYPGSIALFDGGENRVLYQYTTDSQNTPKLYSSATVNPLADVFNRGTIYVFKGGAGYLDYAAISLKDADDLYSWHPIVPFTLGDDLLAAKTGDFSADADWTKGTSWYISGGVATHIPSTNVGCLGSGNPAACCSGVDAGTCGAANINQNSIVSKYKAYIVTYTITRTAGTIYVYAGAEGKVRAASGTYTQFIFNSDASDTHVYFFANADFAGTLDNVQIKEVIPY